MYFDLIQDQCALFEIVMLWEVVALEKAKVQTPEEAYADEKKKKIFNRFMDEVPMAGYYEDSEDYVKGI